MTGFGAEVVTCDACGTADKCPGERIAPKRIGRKRACCGACKAPLKVGIETGCEPADCDGCKYPVEFTHDGLPLLLF